METLEDDKRQRIGRKGTRRRKLQRHPSVHYPENLRVGEDAHEDVASARGKLPQHINQSVFSLIAAAGSNQNFHGSFDDESSDSDGDTAHNSREGDADARDSERRPQELQTKTVNEGVDGSNKKTNLTQGGEKNPENKFLRALPKLNLRTSKEKNYMAQSMFLPTAGAVSPFGSLRIPTPRNAPIMSQMLEAEAQLSSSPVSKEPITATFDDSGAQRVVQNPSTLVTRLMEIFGFEKPEEVISEYPCWLLQTVLLQGYMYITDHHICFYAYLPKKSNVTVKSGYLSKRGKQNPKFNRYWFTLKGDVFSYYSDPSDLYFPSGNIDLRYGISAALAEHKEKSKDVTNFTVTTHQRTYFFKADSPASAKEWVKTLQKVIFRSHNDGDSVKISLPIENVIDIEENPVVDFAETFRIRAVDSNETYAIEEYFFSFFSFGKDALEVLKTMVDDTTAQRIPRDYLTPLSGHGVCSSRDRSRGSSRSQNIHARSPVDPSTPVLHESIRATLPPVSYPISSRGSPRASGEWSRPSFGDNTHRRSMDVSRELSRASFEIRGRRSASTSRMHFDNKSRIYRSPSGKPQGSSDSYVHSLEPSTESSIPNYSSEDMRASASQILSRSDVFHAPTINHLTKSPTNAHDDQRSPLADAMNSTLPGGEIPIQHPLRRETQERRESYTEHRKHAYRDTLDETDDRREQLTESNSTPTLQQLVKAGSYPLQRAAGFAGYLKKRSKKMSNLLATESMGYVEKVSGMWAGGRRHYGETDEMDSQDHLEEQDEDDDGDGYGERFRAHFALQASEKLQATYFGYLHRVLPLYGKVYISDRNFCFRSLIPGTRTKMILPLKDIENVDKEKGFRFGYSGLVVVIKAFEELFFEFGQSEVRDDCAVTLLQNMDSIKYLQESGLWTQQDKEESEAAKVEHQMLQEARMEGYNEHDLKLPKSVEASAHSGEAPPILFDDPRASILNFKPTESLKITCLTIGSRGDVQPYIALCKGLLAEGHRPKIATHAEFEPWVRKHGIEFAPVEGDPAELMRICVENGMFTYSFLKEASAKFRGWIDELLSSAWKACQDTDLLIESPSAMAGIHIAEALGVPYFRAFTMPWTRTRAYPHAFTVPERKMGGYYNYMSYVMFDHVFWTAIAGQVNRWRKKELCLRSTNLDKLHPNKVPFLYNFSPSVVVPPLDYSDWIRVTGYWFLDEASDWTPPKELTDFIHQARVDNKKIVYIGFGSIVVSDPAALTRTVVESVLKADVRCILSKGWSDRLSNQDATVPEVSLPPEILQIKSAPHDWLFKQIDAATHHGGAGTTGASLRAGLPTIVKPFFGDQFFFGTRIEDMGVGVCMKKLNVSVFSRALWEVTQSERMIIKAKVLGEQIRKEDGVATAIQAIYRDLEYAKTLIKHHTVNPDQEIGDEESWTFVGDEGGDPELARRIATWEPAMHLGERKKSSVVPGEDGTSRGAGPLGIRFLRRKSKETVPSV